MVTQLFLLGRGPVGYTTALAEYGNGTHIASMHDSANRNAHRLHVGINARGSVGFTNNTGVLVAGPTSGVEFGGANQNRASIFLTPPVAADVTISGSILFNLWANEAAMTDNAAINMRVVKVDGATGALTQIHKTVRTTEMGTSAALESWSETPAAGVALVRGDRIGLIPFSDDSASATMAGGGTATLVTDGVTVGASGDSYVTFTENISFETTDPTGTTVYPTTTAASGGINPGAGTELEAWTSRGGGVANSNVPTVNGPTAGIQHNYGGIPVDWFTRPLQAVTLSGPVLVNLRAIENSGSANVMYRCEIAKVANDGTGAVVWGMGGMYSELLTTEAAYRFVVEGDDLAIAAGERLRIRFYADDACWGTTTSVVNMVTSFFGTVYFNGTTAAASGDTYLIFPVTLAESTGGLAKTGTFVATGGGVATAVASTARSKLLTATGGGVLVSTRQGSHGKTFTATGGGLSTFVRSSARGGTFLAVGGGIATTTRQKGALRAITATGGGVAVIVDLAVEAHTGSFIATGGGVLSTTRSTTRAKLLTATGGGVATTTRAKGALLALTGTGGGILTTVRTSARARAITATGGGIYTQLNLKAVTRLLTGTGGGILTSILSKGSGRTVTGTGGGVATVQGQKSGGSESHSGSFVATGGGVLVSTRQKGALRALTATASGQLAPITIGAHGGPATATGGGVLLVDGRAARVKTITATGGGAAVLVPRKGVVRVLAATGGGALTWLYSTLHRLALTATGGGVATFSTGSAQNKTGTFTATGGGRLVLTASPVHSKAFGATGGGVASLTASRGFGHALVATGGGVLTMAAGSGRVAVLWATGGGLLTPAWTGSHQRVWTMTGGGRARFVGYREQLDAGFMLEQYVGEQPDDPAFQLETPGGSDVGQPTYILET